MAAVDKAKKLDELVGSVEDLLARLPASLSPKVAALRDAVDDGIFEAWTAISSQRLHRQRGAARAPPLTFGAFLGIALLGLSAKLLIDRRHRSRSR